MPKSKISDPNPSSLAAPTPMEGAPESRLRNAWQAWDIAHELDTQDSKRAAKRGRLYRAYNRFPPSEYSLLAKQGMSWQSNVNFGMMNYIVDNSLSTYYDLITERVYACTIKTKFGTLRERQIYSDHISAAFDKALRHCDDYLLNTEQDLLDMLLYSKGIQMKESKEGVFMEHIPADDVLVPDGTKISFCNFDVLAVKRSYSLHELWGKVKDEKSAKDMGWDRQAVLRAMMYQRKEWRKTYSSDVNKWSKDVAEGNITIASHLKETVDTYIVYIKEFSGKITKCVVMRDYANALVNERGGVRSGKSEDNLKEGIKKEGFLFYKHEYEDSIQNIFSVFMDSAGSGMWHNVKSLGEKVFVQCRQYDFTMNAIMDAVKINMSLMLQANTPEATEKIKALVFGPYTIIPADVPFVQQRLQLPTGEATQTVQFMMLDMFRGIGEYRIHERAQGGEAMTATQSQLDAAESAKLSGTQLKRFNNQQTIHFRKIFKWLTKGLSSGEKDYEYYVIFKEYLEEQNVPKEAWDEDNIESIVSNMISGAGSPSFKIMAAEKTIEFTNMSPKDEGQANAIADGIAALHGRDNVERYINKVTPNKTYNEEKAGHENSLLANPFLNPADVQVQPDDNDLYHLNVHFVDMERTVSLVNENLEKGLISEFLAECASYKLLNQAGHVTAHIDKLSRDKRKQNYTREATARLGQIQKLTQEMAKKMQEVKNKQQAEFDPANDPDIQKKLALAQLDVSTAQKMADIEAGARAASHAQKIEQDKEKHAVDIAGKRMKAAEEAKRAKTKPKTTPSK
jgi:hypothetical protein